MSARTAPNGQLLPDYKTGHNGHVAASVPPALGQRVSEGVAHAVVAPHRTSVFGIAATAGDVVADLALFTLLAYAAISFAIAVPLMVAGRRVALVGTLRGG